jgi:ABC-type transport system substrate-binding protein
MPPTLLVRTDEVIELELIVPDLATSCSWNEDGTELTLPLRPMRGRGAAQDDRP